MSFTALILRNRHAVWALVVGVVIVGLVAYQRIPVRLFPETAPPMVNVVTTWPGAAAADVDQDLTEVLATELASLAGVASTRATSQDNLSRITVEFQYDTDVRMAAVDVQNAVARIGADLPEGAEPPRVLTFSTADRPVYTVGVIAADLRQARVWAEDVIAPRLQAVDGVAAVDVFGGHVPTVLVDVDPARAEAHRLPLARIAAAVEASNMSSPAGRLRGPQGETMLRVDQRRDRVGALEGIVLATTDGGQVRLGELATITRGATPDDAWFAIDGKRAIAVQVYRAEDANTVAVVRQAAQVVAALEAELPGVTLLPGEESASFTELSVDNLLSNVWQALALAAAILFLFLGRARAAAVTAFTMPLSFGLTFGAMWGLGIEFNMVTLSAVILAVGMVVDASVVVLENIVRLHDEGRSDEESARQGTDEVLMPVLAGTATTLVVLIPLMSLPGFVGKTFGPLAATLLLAFGSSVIVALVLVPILSLHIHGGGRFEALAAGLTRPYQVLMDRVQGGYVTLLGLGLRHRALALGLALLSFGAGLAGLRAAGMNLLPRMDGGAFTVAIETRSGSSLDQTVEVVRQVQAVLDQQPEVTLVQAQVGFEPGMTFAGGSGVMGPTQALLSVTLTPRTERERDLWAIQDVVRASVDRVPGVANVVVKAVGNTAKPDTAAPVVARLSGPDPLVLDHLGDQVQATLATVDGVVQPSRAWRRDLSRVLLRVDERRAAALGQTPQALARQLALGSEGLEVGTFRPPLGEGEPVLVRYQAEPGIEARLGWPLALADGEVAPMRAVMRAERSVEQGLFSSQDLSPTLEILAEVDERPLSFVTADAERALAGLSIPLGYRLEMQGENADLVESREAILGALAISVVAVYLLLVAQFRSWIHPITVMMAIPLSLVGVSAALAITGKPVSMPVMVGLVLLVGTVVNNSILLVDLTRSLREQGHDRQQALRQAVGQRFRPIMMTSMSTVVGMLPLALELALGAERFSPLAIAVIGGLSASTMLTLVVIPVLYDVLDGLRLPWSRSAAVGLATVLLALVLPGTAQAQVARLEDAWRAVQAHPSAVASEERVEAAQARATAAMSRLLPQAELSARATWRDPFEPAVLSLPITLPDGSSPDPIVLGEGWDKQQALGATVSQPLFTGGALLQGRVAAKRQAEAARAGAQRSQAELWRALVGGWHGLAVAEEAEALQAELVEATGARLAALQRLQAGGRAVEAEVATVALRQAEARLRLAEAQATRLDAQLALEALVGESVRPAPARDPARGLVVLARQGLARSLPEGVDPVVTEAQALAGAARARGRAQGGSLLPSVAARFHASYANPDLTEFPVRAEWGSYWDASVIATWTLDGGLRWSEARAARMDAAAAEHGAQALALRAGVDRAQAERRLALSGVQLDLAADRVRLAERAVLAADTALQVGSGTSLDLLDRQIEQTQARLAELRVAFDTLVAIEAARATTGAYGP